mmetsp:Transcript_23134/g.71540  ORF Transcript_23134/g.71540 Transcript_23134/m.71540 type:complete len:232 (-) Transcript_23134:489-1184(-)
MKTNSSSMAVMSPPRLAGLRKPSTAKSTVTTPMPVSCTPQPHSTLSMPGAAGGRNTSPCTSFQPVSSCASSTVSSWLYFEMSRCSVRSMIMATMPDRKSTIISELMIENQWIWSSVMSRYVSQRLAHLISDSRKRTSYVKMTSLPLATSCGSPSCETYTIFSGSHVESAPLLPCLCAALKGSTSKPTMRLISVSMSLWMRMVRRTWLCKYACALSPFWPEEAMKPTGKPRS